MLVSSVFVNMVDVNAAIAGWHRPGPIGNACVHNYNPNAINPEDVYFVDNWSRVDSCRYIDEWFQVGQTANNPEYLERIIEATGALRGVTYNGFSTASSTYLLENDLSLLSDFSSKNGMVSEIGEFNYKHLDISNVVLPSDTSFWPTNLDKLRGLSSIDISHNRIQDSSFLHMLSANTFFYLHTLDLSHNNISDINPVERILWLRNINLENNPNITDITPIMNLHLLNSLNLKDTNVTNQSSNIDQLVCRGVNVILPNGSIAEVPASCDGFTAPSEPTVPDLSGNGYWGPVFRPTFPLGNPAPFPVLNSMTNNPAVRNGSNDERDFVKVSATNNLNDLTETLEVTDGQEVYVFAYVHNNAAAGVTARNVIAQFDVNREAWQSTITGKFTNGVDGFIHSSNASPATVYDRGSFTADQPFRISYVPDSAQWEGMGAPIMAIDDPTTGTGAWLGNIQSGVENSGWVSFKARITFEDVYFSLDKSIHGPDSSDGAPSSDAKPGDIVNIRLTYAQTGSGIFRDNITLKSQLPAGLEYVVGSSKINDYPVSDIDIQRPNFADNATNNITTTGLNIGGFYGSGSTTVTFDARVMDADAFGICGMNYLSSTSRVIVDGNEKTASVDIRVEKDCDSPNPPVSGWGPSRPTFTLENPAPYNTFNSMTNNPAVMNGTGDERDFVKVATDRGNTSTITESLTVTDGQEAYVLAYVHNNAAPHLSMVAQNVMAKFDTNRNAEFINGQYVLPVTGWINSASASPASVWDSAQFTADKPFSISYVENSAQWAQYGQAVKTISNPTVGNGASIGSVQGCTQYSGWVTFKVKINYDNQNEFTLTNSVRHDGQGVDDWENSISAKTGDIVNFRLVYTQTGDVTRNNVIMRSQLPVGLEYIVGSARIANASHPNAPLVKDINPDADTETKNITTIGLNIGNYTNSSNAVITFSARVADANLLANCGANMLTNAAEVMTGADGKKSADSVVNVERVCQTIPDGIHPDSGSLEEEIKNNPSVREINIQITNNGQSIRINVGQLGDGKFLVYFYSTPVAATCNGGACIPDENGYITVDLPQSLPSGMHTLAIYNESGTLLGYARVEVINGGTSSIRVRAPLSGVLNPLDSMSASSNNIFATAFMITLCLWGFSSFLRKRFNLSIATFFSKLG